MSIGVLILAGGHAQLTDVKADNLDCGFLVEEGADMVVATSKVTNSRLLGCVVSGTLPSTHVEINQPSSTRSIGCAVFFSGGQVYC